jgi:hypothetical protein
MEYVSLTEPGPGSSVSEVSGVGRASLLVTMSVTALGPNQTPAEWVTEVQATDNEIAFSRKVGNAWSFPYTSPRPSLYGN